MLHGAPQHVVLHERRSLRRLQALLHRAQAVLRVRAQADGVVRVRELRVARERGVRHADRVRDALPDDVVLDLDHVRVVEVGGGAPRAEGARAVRERVEPLHEREALVEHLHPARALVDELVHAVRDRELGARDQLRKPLPELVQVLVVVARLHRALEVRRGAQRQRQVAPLVAVGDQRVRELVGEAALDDRHHPPRVMSVRAPPRRSSCG